MINLRAIYGDKLFDRKSSYRNARYIPFLASLMLDIVIAFGIIRIFDVNWNYAFIKVYGIVLLYGVLKYVLSTSIDFLNYRVAIKDALSSEIRHYLSALSINVEWDEIGTYDDFLLESAFNETLPGDLRVLAAINYGVISDAVSIIPHFENRCYKLFCKIVPEFLLDHEKHGS
jgi:hypothetical protein